MAATRTPGSVTEIQAGGHQIAEENTRLKRIVSDKELEIDALREVAKGNF